MAWDKKRPYAPFGKGGNLSYWSPMTLTDEDIDSVYSGWIVRDKLGQTFKPFEEVQLKLTYKEFKKSKGAVVFYWQSERGTTYPMFVAELDRLLREGLLSATIDGYWTVEKRGVYYGIKLKEMRMI